MDNFHHFRDTTPGESDIQTCEAREAEIWTIYGRVMEGPAEYLGYAVHDAQDEQAAVSMAVAIRDATGKGFMVGDTAHGLMPREPEMEFTAIAEWLTDAIHDDLPDLADDWARADDFDTHPMAGLREAFVDHSDYAGIPETNQ